MAPVLLDSVVGNKSLDGHDYRSDFKWLLEQGFQWVITDAADVWDAKLRAQGKRNTHHLLAEGAAQVDGVANGWYRRHVRQFTRL